MRQYDVTALYQAAAGVVNTQFHSGRCCGIRIVPKYGPLFVGNYFPRTILVDDSKTNAMFRLADPSWFVIDKEVLQSAYFGGIADKAQNLDTSLSTHITGPRITLRFGIENPGSNASDEWIVYVAEDPIDLLTPIEPNGIQLLYNPSTNLYIPAQGSNGVPIVAPTTIYDAQVFDQTSAGGAAMSINISNNFVGRHFVCRVAGLTAASTRVLSILGVRNDTTTVTVYSTGAFGATITDVELVGGTGDQLISLFLGSATSTAAGYAYSGCLPSNYTVNLSAGAAGDNPRMTVWTRGQS